MPGWLSDPAGTLTSMPSDKVYPPGDRPEIEILRDGRWLFGDLHAWQARGDEQWAVVSWHIAGLTWHETVPADHVRKAGLSDLHRGILDFETENQYWKFAAAKETAILERFQISATRYFMVLEWLLDQPEALEYAPATVRRLARLRDARREARSSDRAE